MNKRYPVWISA